jgi:outer membrane autotransporter protein
MGEKLKGDSNGQGISGYVETRYDWGNINHWILQPLASFQFSYLALDSYTERGGTSSLEYDDQSYNSYKGSLGVKLTQELFKRNSDRRESIQLRGRWIHEFGDDNSSVDAHFSSDPDVVFKVSDEGIARDSAALGASFNTDLSRYTQLSFGYDAHLNHDNNLHILSAMFVYRW